MPRTKQQVKDDLRLDTLPDDEFMQLLEDVGEGPIVAGKSGHSAKEYTPEQIAEVLEAELVAGTVGDLLAKARAESGLSLSEVGEEVGVSRGRVNQLEKSENLEVATLVRMAGALGYRVQISLEPITTDKKPLKVELSGL